MTPQNQVSVAFEINGATQHLQVEPGETLLHTLRDRMALTGTKEGCVEGECGACTVLVDGNPVDSCILATATLEGRRVRTIEGLASNGELSALQRAFVDHGAVQCGFCIPGFLMTLTALLEQNPSPSQSDVKESMAGNICRCTGYGQMLEAVTAVIADGEVP